MGQKIQVISGTIDKIKISIALAKLQITVNLVGVDIVLGQGTTFHLFIDNYSSN